MITISQWQLWESYFYFKKEEVTVLTPNLTVKIMNINH